MHRGSRCPFRLAALLTAAVAGAACDDGSLVAPDATANADGSLVGSDALIDAPPTGVDAQGIDAPMPDAASPDAGVDAALIGDADVDGGVADVAVAFEAGTPGTRDAAVFPVPAPWTALTLSSGDPTFMPTGTSGFVEGRYFIESLDKRGLDVGGTVDEMQFVHRSARGDSELLARVVTNRDCGESRSRMGLQFREALNAESPYFMAAITATRDLLAQYRTTAKAATRSLGSEGIAPGAVWLRIARNGDAFTAGFSTDGEHWRHHSRSFVLAPDLYVGMAVASRDTDERCSAMFERVRFRDHSVPAPYVQQEIGTTSADDVGRAAFTGGVYTVHGVGANMDEGSSDAFHSVHTQVVGDVVVEAHLTGFEAVADEARAGIVVRTAVDEGAAGFALVVDRRGDLRFKTRSRVDSSFPVTTMAAGVGKDVWLRLVRRGDEASAFYATDGVIWLPLGTGTIRVTTDDVFVGLAVTSGEGPAVATFEGLAVRPAP